MDKKQARIIALNLIVEQIENTSYSLERDDYKNLPIEEIEIIEMEIFKITEQIKKRYNADYIELINKTNKILNEIIK